MKSLIASLVVALILAAPTLASAQRVIYVDADATGANDGSSWAGAFVFLQDALAAAQAGDEVWVGEGVYRPDQGAGMTAGDREASFEIPSGVALYGGFAGLETSRDERDWTRHETVLTGDLLRNDDGPLGYDNPLRAENAREVVRVIGPTAVVRIDGVTISGARKESGLFARCCGSALVFKNSADYPAQLFVENCRVVDNTSPKGSVYIYGGAAAQPNYSFVLSRSDISGNWALEAAGLYITQSRVLIRDVVFSLNQARVTSVLRSDSFTDILRSIFTENTATYGGAIHARGENDGLLRIWSSRFVGNRSEQWGGGAIRVDGSHLVSVNNVFTGNSTPATGGALELADYSALIVNNVFAFNTAGERGGAIESVDYHSTLIANSIFWENDAPQDRTIYSHGRDTIRVRNSISAGDGVLDGVDDGSFLVIDPRFVDPDGPDNLPGTPDDDFTLEATSPAIDAGDDSLLPGDALDMDGDGDTDEKTPGDLVGNARTFDGGSGVDRIDIGAQEAGAPPMGTWVSRPDLPASAQGARFRVFPNPARTVVGVRWEVSSASVDLVLFDPLGRVVADLFTGTARAGETLTLRLPSLRPGLYFVVERRSRGSAPILVR